MPPAADQQSVLGYAYIMDAFSTYYGPEKAENAMFIEKLFGYYAGIYWATILFNVLLPQLLWFRALRLNQLWSLISHRRDRRHVVRTIHDRRRGLHRPHLPSAYGLYHGTIWDWLTMMGTVGLFVFGILLIVRLMPVISMFEMRAILAPRRP